MDSETLRQSLLALVMPNAHPLTAIRIDQILALHRIVTQLEAALTSHPALIEDPKHGPRLHPLLDALAKNRERLRRAINDLERTLPKPPRLNPRGKALQSLTSPVDETAEECGSGVEKAHSTHPAPASSPSPPRGRGRGEGQPHTNDPAQCTPSVGADLRVRPTPGRNAPPLHPNRAGFLRHAASQLSP